MLARTSAITVTFLLYGTYTTYINLYYICLFSSVPALVFILYTILYVNVKNRF
jgi:hypothetical protein